MSYGHFLTQILQLLMNFHDNSKNKNRNNQKINFSFDSTHCPSFMKMGSKLREGGVDAREGSLHILSWGRASVFHAYFIYISYMFHKCFIHISYIFLKYFMNISHIFLKIDETSFGIEQYVIMHSRICPINISLNYHQLWRSSIYYLQWKFLEFFRKIFLRKMYIKWLSLLAAQWG